MTASALPPSAPSDSLWSSLPALLPFMLVVFTGYLATGMALPVVPRHVHDALGQGTSVVGMVMGVQYAAAVFARAWAGTMTDGRGPRPATRVGLVCAIAVGGCYLASTFFAAVPASMALVVAGRLLSGATEAFVLTSSMAWALLRLGPSHAGKVLAWIGVALFGGFAVGAPLGNALYGAFGLHAVAFAIMASGVLGLVGTTFLQPVAPSHLPRLPFARVLGAIRAPGFALTLATFGYAMIIAFAVLLFAQRGWGGGALAVSCMSAGFIAGRLLLGHLPDKMGGVRVARAAVMVEAVALALIWLSPHPAGALLGAALTGASYGLAFQGFGVEAVARTPPQSRGAAMGAYLIFQDVALGIGPVLGGLLAAVAGLDAVYLAAAGAAAVAMGLGWSMQVRRSAPPAR